MNELQNMKSSERKRLILEISGSSQIGFNASTLLNDLVLIESEKYLEENGRPYSVRSAKKHQMKKMGDCYRNAGEKIREGYGYVEGYIKHKEYEWKNAHAWNINKDGSHIDFTLGDASDYEYFGAIIPERDVYLTGLRNGGIWYCVIPFLSNVVEQSFRKRKILVK